MNMFARHLSWILIGQAVLSLGRYSFAMRILDQAMDLVKTFEREQYPGDDSEEEKRLETEELREQLYSLDTDYWSVAQRLKKRLLDQRGKRIYFIWNKIARIFRNAGIIQTSYKSFLSHFPRGEIIGDQQKQNFTETFPSGHFTGSSELIFSDFTSLTTKDLTDILQRGASDDVVEEKHCHGMQSTQQLLYQFYEAVTWSCVKALVVQFHLYSVNEEADNANHKYWREREMSKLRNKLYEMSGVGSDLMPLASKIIVSCPISDLRDALQLQVFQKYLVHQSDMTSLWQAVVNSCPEFKQARAGCNSDSCLALPEHKRCRGLIRDCETIPNNIIVCFSAPEDPSRYRWIETDDGEKYGCAPSDTDCKKMHPWGYNTTGCNTLKRFNYWLLQKFCFCNCEDDKIDIDRHFGLTSAISDIQDNKVVTGARLVKRNHVFYIQIQQGKLESNARIADRPEWKEVDEVPLSSWNSSTHNNMIYTVTHDQNTVKLGDVKAGPGELLTGLKFARINSVLALQIRITPFNLSTGELYPGKSSWSNLQIISREDGSDSNPKTTRNRVNFTVTSMRDDLGQRTTPLLDAQPLVLEQPMPLSGAGFWLRNNLGTVTFLTLRLFNYDLTELI